MERLPIYDDSETDSVELDFSGVDQKKVRDNVLKDMGVDTDKHSKGFWDIFMKIYYEMLDNRK